MPSVRSLMMHGIHLIRSVGTMVFLMLLFVLAAMGTSWFILSGLPVIAMTLYGP